MILKCCVAAAYLCCVSAKEFLWFPIGDNVLQGEVVEHSHQTDLVTLRVYTAGMPSKDFTVNHSRCSKNKDEVTQLLLSKIAKNCIERQSIKLNFPSEETLAAQKIEIKKIRARKRAEKRAIQERLENESRMIEEKLEENARKERETKEAAFAAFDFSNPSWGKKFNEAVTFETYLHENLSWATGWDRASPWKCKTCRGIVRENSNPKCEACDGKGVMTFIKEYENTPRKVFHYQTKHTFDVTTTGRLFTNPTDGAPFAAITAVVSGKRVLGLMSLEDFQIDYERRRLSASPVITQLQRDVEL